MRTYPGLLTNAVRSALRSKHDLMLENLAPARLRGPSQEAESSGVDGPPQGKSSCAVCFGTRAVWRCGRTMTPVISSIRSVRAARYPKVGNGYSCS